MQCAKILGLSTIAVLLWVGLACGGQREDAVALVKEAVAYFEANGREKAFEAFNDREGRFIKGELYIFVIDLEGLTLCHPINPRLVGKDMSEIRDAGGKYFAKEFIQVAKDPGYGWVDYKWTNPTTKKIEAKTSYIERAGDILMGCGIYQ